MLTVVPVVAVVRPKGDTQVAVPSSNGAFKEWYMVMLAVAPVVMVVRPKGDIQVAVPSSNGALIW